MTARHSLVIVLALLAGACASSSNPAGTRRPQDSAAPFWPADPDRVAVISSTSEIAATDGNTVVVLGALPRASAASTVSDGRLVAMNSGGELAAVDLATGHLARASCSGCWGAAVVNGQIVSVDAGFVLHVYDANLNLKRLIPIDHVTEPRTADFPPDQQIPEVKDAVGGKVLVSYLTSNGGARRGPTALSLYTIDGALEQSWTVDGLVYSSAIDADGTRLVMGVGGSSGACSTLSVPVVFDISRAEPIVLVPTAHHEDGGRLYFSSDLWWNGTEIVTFGSLSGNGTTANCVVDHLSRRFDITGKSVEVQTDGITKYRLLGPRCDTALLSEQSGEVPNLHFIEKDQRRRIEGYDSILWSAPRRDGCTSFPGLPRS